MAKQAKKAKRGATKRRVVRARAKAPARVSPIPEYLHALTVNLVFKDSNAAIAFYEKAFGARLLSRMASPDGKGIGTPSSGLGTRSSSRTTSRR